MSFFLFHIFFQTRSNSANPIGIISGSDLPLTSELEWHPESWAKLFLSPIRTLGNMFYSFGTAPKLFESGFSLAPSLPRLIASDLGLQDGWTRGGVIHLLHDPHDSSRGTWRPGILVRILHSYSQNLGSLEQSLFMLFNAYIFSVGF